MFFIDNLALYRGAVLISYKDGLTSFPNFAGTKLGKFIRIHEDSENVSTIIMNLTPNISEDMVLQDVSVKENWLVIPTNGLEVLNSNLSFFGSIINALGEVCIGSVVSNVLSVKIHLENRTPNILNRRSIHQSLITGLKAINSLIPIGLGQRELIIDDRQTVMKKMKWKQCNTSTINHIYFQNIITYKSEVK